MNRLQKYLLRLKKWHQRSHRLSLVQGNYTNIGDLIIPESFVPSQPVFPNQLKTIQDLQILAERQQPYRLLNLRR